jgi:citrate lyase subunit beta/citryl-CoA lyase
LHAETAGRKHLPVHVLIESHEALANVMAIAAIPQVECLSFGIMDFVSAHFGAIPASAMRSPGQFEHPLVVRAKLEIAAACHRYGKVPSHNVTTEIKDSSIIANDAKRAKNDLGYTRMWSIHPDQIQTIITTMAPQFDEVVEATDILMAAQQKQWAPIQFQGNCMTEPVIVTTGLS